jgi:hypothetical protein
MKYLRFGLTIISFTNEIGHADMAAKWNALGFPESAGFWKFDKVQNKIVTFGRSDSLNLDRKDPTEDELLLNNL